MATLYMRTPNGKWSKPKASARGSIVAWTKAGRDSRGLGLLPDTITGLDFDFDNVRVHFGRLELIELRQWLNDHDLGEA